MFAIVNLCFNGSWRSPIELFVNSLNLTLSKRTKSRKLLNQIFQKALSMRAEKAAQSRNENEQNWKSNVNLNERENSYREEFQINLLKACDQILNMNKTYCELLLCSLFTFHIRMKNQEQIFSMV